MEPHEQGQFPIKSDFLSLIRLKNLILNKQTFRSLLFVWPKCWLFRSEKRYFSIKITYFTICIQSWVFLWLNYDLTVTIFSIFKLNYYLFFVISMYIFINKEYGLKWPIIIIINHLHVYQAIILLPATIPK